ncbi:MAG: hypothetical protein ACYC4A_02380 [Desulfobulbia bacterium]
MIHLNLRSAAFILVLLAFVSLHGAPFADAAASSPRMGDSCCFPSDTQGETLPQSPCATQDCLCLFCMNLHLPRAADVFFLPLSSRGPVCHPLASPLAAFLRPIDYPPERS